MKMKIRPLLNGINAILSLVGIGIIYFTSLFWMGTKSEYDDLIKSDQWSFFANRLLFNTLVGLLLSLIMGAINWLLGKIARIEVNVMNVLVISFLLFFLSSIVFIAFQLS